MLDCVRHGCPTGKTVFTLKQRVITDSIYKKFAELQVAGNTPECLFPKWKACDHFNTEMFQSLTSKVHELECTAEIDETVSRCKMNKKCRDKMNSDCNLTAGLEAKLSLAVGAHVMLRHNIDAKSGLVNGTIGTVLSISVNHVSVKFDHICDPYNVEMVRSSYEEFVYISNAVPFDISICCYYS